MSELKVDKVSPRTGNYVALNTVGSKNIIINGDMSIAQRGTTATGLGNGDTGYHTVDRFEFFEGGSTTGEFTQSQSTDVPSGQGFGYSLKMDCTTADASLGASDEIQFRQKFEGQNLQYLKKGTANAESLTLSFWVKSNKTGTYICELYEFDNTRQISKSYTIDSADTWEKKTITFAGDTSGTTLDNNNAVSLQCTFWLGAGSNFTSGTLSDTWSSVTSANRAVGQVNLADNTANEWYITGVQLEAGTTASDFEFLPYDVNLARCQRYFYTEDNSDTYHALANGHINSATLFIGVIHLPVSLRSSPSFNTSGSFSVNSGGTDFAVSANSITDSTGTNLNTIQVRSTISGATAGNGAFLRNNNDSNAKFQLDAEL